MNSACPWCLYLDLSSLCKLFHSISQTWISLKFWEVWDEHYATSLSSLYFGISLLVRGRFETFHMEVPKQKQLELWSSIKTILYVDLQGIAPCDALHTQQQWQSWRFIKDPLLQRSWFWSWPASCKKDFSVPKVAGRVAEKEVSAGSLVTNGVICLKKTYGGQPFLNHGC